MEDMRIFSFRFFWNLAKCVCGIVGVMFLFFLIFFAIAFKCRLMLEQPSYLAWRMQIRCFPIPHICMCVWICVCKAKYISSIEFLCKDLPIASCRHCLKILGNFKVSSVYFHFSEFLPSWFLSGQIKVLHILVASNDFSRYHKYFVGFSGRYMDNICSWCCGI